jgi:hypothetical protein
MRTPEPPKDQIRQLATTNDELDQLRASFDAARNGHGDRRRNGRDRRQHPRDAASDRRRPTP